MTHEQNARLARIIKILSMENNENVGIKVICRRIVYIFGVNGIMALFTKSAHKHNKFLSLFDGVLLATCIPCLREITGRKELSWSLGLAIGLSQLKRKVPTWIVSYCFIESVADELKRWIRYDAVDEKHWVRVRQIFTSFLIPIFYCRSASRGRLHWILFGKRSVWNDFLFLFGVWNTVKTYQALRGVLLKEKKGKATKRRSTISLGESSDNTHVHQGSMTQLLMRRLDEFNELSSKASRTPIIERIYGFFFGDHLFKCLKWTIWRKMIQLIFSGKRGMCLKSFQKSIIIMLTFVILDGSEPLNINWTLLKYLGRSILSQELSRTSHYDNVLLFSSLNLAYYRAMVHTNDK